MLGRLAKGVGGLAKGVAALGEARAALTAVQNDEAEVEALLQRISGSLLPEYRRQAMSQLKDLLVDNPKAQLAFGTMGIPVLIAVLRDDRDDVALLQGALEALVAATTGPPETGLSLGGRERGEHHHDHHHDHHHHPQQQAVTAAEAQAAAINAELLARQREHVGLLLGLLEDEPVGVPDFYVRYHTVQLLTALLNHCAARLQEAILSTPMSVVRLTELLGERSEVIRNEALLLLAALTRAEAGPPGGAAAGGSEVQKIAAFEGAFDRVAELLREEGGLDGGMVVQDCVELMNNLLRGNMANQRLFREMGHVTMLPRLITSAVPAGGGGGAAASPAAAAAAAAAGGGQFAQAAGPIPFLNGGAGGGGGGFDGGEEPSLELHNALAALAAAGTDALLGPRQLPRQKAANMLGLMETLRLLCGPPVSAADPDRATEQCNRTANQGKLLAAGALEALLAAALQDGGVPSTAVRAAALGALGDMVDGQAACQERLSRALVLPGQGPAGAEPPEAAAHGGGGAAGVAGPDPGREMPALQAVLRVALYGTDATECAAADHVIACYCRGNADGQAGLTSTIGPLEPQFGSSSSNGNGLANGGGYPGHAATRGSFGQDLVAALLAGGSALGSTAAPVAATAGAGAGTLGRYGGAGAGSIPAANAANGGLVVTCRAAGVLQHLLVGNLAAKQRLLAVPLEVAGPGVPPDYLMPRLVRHLTAALRPPCSDLARLVVCTLLRLLLVWLQDCPPAGAAMLESAAHLPLLVDVVTGRQGPAAQAAAAPAPQAPGAAPAAPPAQGAGAGDPVVCGLAACVLGTCMLYGKTAAALPAGTQSPSDLVLDVIMSRVGLSLFFFRLDDLRRSPTFAAALAAPSLQATKPLTRAATAAAVVAAEQAAAAAAAAGAVADGVGAFQLGHDVAGMVSDVEDAVRQRAMEVFSRPAGHRGQDGVPSCPAEVPGPDDASRLGWAVAQLGRMAREVDELRSRNRALAEDLFRLSQGLNSAPSPPPPLAGGQLAAIHQGPLGAPPGAPGPHGPAPMGVAMTSAADVEARVALELRAGRAEQEVAALRQQMEVLSVRLYQAEVDAGAAREAAAAAHMAAHKAEADLADLSSAYNNLETHAFATEAQLRSAQGALVAVTAAAAAAEARALAGAGHPPSMAGESEADIQRRIEEAVAEARDEAKAEADDSMTDLFVCLGQEERKVEVLRQALEQRGVDVEGLLATIAEEEGADNLR